jgi:hypothetical protein
MMLAATRSPRNEDPFGEVPHTAAQHFKLALFGAIARVIEQCTDGDVVAALDAHPFLTDYHDELVSQLGGAGSLAAAWRAALTQWEARSAGHLPIRALLAGADRLSIDILLTVGLIEEDPRFGDVFEAAQGRERRPTVGVLLAWWRTSTEGGDDAEAVRRAVLRLVQAGLLTALNPESPRPDWVLTVPHPLWDALRGDPPTVRWLSHVAYDSLPRLDTYIAPAGTEVRCATLPGALRSSAEQIVVVRGPAHNGRTTLLASVAQALGKSLLIIDVAVVDDEPRWHLFGALAALLNALPVVKGDLGSGETRILPPLPTAGVPIGVVASAHGAWTSSDGRPIITIDLALPSPEERALHWRAAVPLQSDATRERLAAAARLTSGNVRRAARMASSLAELAGRVEIDTADLRQAARALQPARLETLATLLESAGTLSDIMVDDATREELEALEARCRHRERLAASSPRVASTGAGVRALFTGASGTGKTLAARLLASSLRKDLYRVDLSATVNKYLGETEKNIDHAFAAAEELDVILLLDEGDALMANRTDVGSSNDRYANLETNYLLQRIETFEGILFVTSNAADRIDKAFARRMDVVITFRPPDEWRRYEILKQHLGDDIDEEWLQQIACRCALTGGQLRNVATHAHLLALETERPVTAGHVYAALAREYRKGGASCPVRAADAMPRPAIARR